MKNLLASILMFSATIAHAAPPTSAKVTSAEMASDWPLTVDTGELACERGTFIKFTAGGKTYAVNGSAKDFSRSKGLGWRDVREIWRDNPEIPGTKIPISALIAKGQKLCQP